MTPSLFDDPEPWKARITDPITSHEADQAMKGAVLRDQQALVLRALYDYCRTYEGGTAWELWCSLEGNPRRPKENVLAKRLGELKEEGMCRVNVGVTRPGSSHRHQQEWTITDDGAHFCADRSAA